MGIKMLVLLKSYGVKMYFFCWLFVYMPGSLGPGLHWGKKKKKSTSEVSAEGKATGPLPFSTAVGPCSRLHARSK